MCKSEPADEQSVNELETLESTELSRTKRLEGLHLTFNLEAGELLPLAIRYCYTFKWTVILYYIYLLFVILKSHIQNISTKKTL